MKWFIACKFTFFVALGALVAFYSGYARATTIAAWSFTGTNAGPVGTISATTGTGTGVELGMTNNYTYTNGEGPGSVNGSDINSQAGTANPSFTEDTWRIRGNSNSKNAGAGMANGWNSAAPEYSQGAEFDINTTGYTDLVFTYDWYDTTQGVKDLMEQYTTDGGATWINFLSSPLVGTANDYYGGAANEPEITMDLSSTPGVANNPNFGIRLVSAYDPTSGTYLAANGGTLNNNSGNWRFGNLTLSGVAVPEPTSLLLAGLGAVFAGAVALRRRSAA